MEAVANTVTIDEALNAFLAEQRERLLRIHEAHQSGFGKRIDGDDGRSGPLRPL